MEDDEFDEPTEWELKRRQVVWDIRREGRAWSSREEVESRYFLAPGKMEMIGGKLYWSDEDRLFVLGMLLENVGIDKAVRLGNPDVWREAIVGLENFTKQNN